MTSSITQPLVPTLAPSIASLQPWVDAGVFGVAELHATEVITRSDPQASPLVHLGAALALWAPLHGHVCIDLSQAVVMTRAELAELADDQDSDRLGTEAAVAPSTFDTLSWPNPEQWSEALRASAVVRVVSTVDPEPVFDTHPLVLNGLKLYTQRQWVDECIVATSLRARCTGTAIAALSDSAEALLSRLLPATELNPVTHENDPNTQHQAALAAVSSTLGVIVGGPGTGKTHTIARLLAVMLHNARESDTTLRIALAAPTGKAATRLREAIITAASATHDSSPILPAEIADQLNRMPTTTVHRLLGPRGLNSTRFNHNASNPLPHDVVVIDETSMVSLPLMARLLEAVRPDATLILVGDPDQLESIEVGSVLANMVTAAQSPESPLHQHVVRLNRPRRQQSGSPIAPLADAIRDNLPNHVVELLRAGASDATTGLPLLTFVEHRDPNSPTVMAAVRAVVAEPCAASLAAALDNRANDALRELTGVRVLCAHKHGPFGAETWNHTIEQWMLGSAASTRFYPGRALLITRNDPRTHLANGDTGVVVAQPEGPRAAFRVGDEVRLFAPAQLESVETAFAMTIHKSQGSEYDTVVVVLPPESSPLIGRELLYTAVTRTTRRLIVVGTAAAVVKAVQTPGSRITGLTAALASAPL